MKSSLKMGNLFLLFWSKVTSCEQKRHLLRFFFLHRWNFFLVINNQFRLFKRTRALIIFKMCPPSNPIFSHGFQRVKWLIRL